MARKPAGLLRFTLKDHNKTSPHVTGPKIAVNLFYAWMIGRGIPCELHKRRIDIPVVIWDGYDVQIIAGIETINAIFYHNFQKKEE